MTPALSPGARDAILASLLSRHGDAPIATITDEGLFVPPPEAPELEGRSTLPGRSAIDLVVLPDRVRVVEAWEEALRAGASRVRVELVASGGRHADFHFVDMTHRLGVFVGLLVADADGGSEAFSPPPRPGERSVASSKHG
jgi:hypothetical protein